MDDNDNNNNNNNNNNNGKRRSKKVGLGLILGVIFGIIILLFVCIYYFKEISSYLKRVPQRQFLACFSDMGLYEVVEDNFYQGDDFLQLNKGSIVTVEQYEFDDNWSIVYDSNGQRGYCRTIHIRPMHRQIDWRALTMSE